jgi:two-component system, OmpR family, phosphate regulon response regulator OmpR
MMHMEAEKIQQFSARPHVLVVDDDRRIRELVSRFLKENGFVVLSAPDATQARRMLENFIFDALVVDVMMPGESGLELTKFVRSSSDIPVLLLTALGESQERIAGLESGADDYLPKPFEPKELVLRLGAILRRTAPPMKSAGPLKIGRWTFDPVLGELSDGRQALRLTSVETNLIRALARRPGQVMSRTDLARACGVESSERTIDVQVTRLRRKIEEDTRAPRYLLTARGKGYMLRTEEGSE